MARQRDIHDLINEYKMKGEPFALATVVRTVSVTAAKAGAKAVILADGRITGGWVGGGCARDAVLKASREALADGQPKLISIQPDDLLKDLDLAAGEAKDGVVYAKNSCPSKGTMDIFIEAVLPSPPLHVLGASPVAVAVAELGQRMGFFTTVFAPKVDHPSFVVADELVDGFGLPEDEMENGFIVVATQGKGDKAALEAVAKVSVPYVSFVGSRKKMAALRENLISSGFASSSLERIKAPAGLDIGAITPEEIAFSIIAEIIEFRRRGQRML